MKSSDLAAKIRGMSLLRGLGLEVRRRIPGEWSVTLGAVLSMVLSGLVAAGVFGFPIGWPLGVVGVAGGVSLVAGTVRRRSVRCTVLLAVLTILGGCASAGSDGWTKPGMTEEQLGHDTLQCLTEARQILAAREGPRTRIDQDRYRQCMAGRGYTAGQAN